MGHLRQTLTSVFGRIGHVSFYTVIEPIHRQVQLLGDFQNPPPDYIRGLKDSIHVTGR